MPKTTKEIVNNYWITDNAETTVWYSQDEVDELIQETKHFAINEMKEGMSELIDYYMKTLDLLRKELIKRLCHNEELIDQVDEGRACSQEIIDSVFSAHNGLVKDDRNSQPLTSKPNIYDDGWDDIPSKPNIIYRLGGQALSTGKIKRKRC